LFSPPFYPLSNTAMHFVGQDNAPPDGHKKSTKNRAMNLLALLFSVFLITVFQASITASVLIERPVSPFNSLRDITTCRIRANRVCVSGTGAARSFWDDAIASTPCIADNPDDPQNSPVEVESFLMGFENVEKGVCDYFYTLSGQILSQTSNRYCGKLTPVGDPFFETSVGFLLPLGSPWTKNLSRGTLFLLEENKLQTSEQYANSISKCLSVTDTTLQWSKLKVFFYLAFGAELVLLTIMILDRPHTDEETNPNKMPDLRARRLQTSANTAAPGEEMLSAPNSGISNTLLS
jgi:hypothetical protein